jgi:hypothetical protein
VFCVVACNWSEGADFKKVVARPDQIFLEGTLDTEHDLVVEIEGWAKPLDWRTRGSSGDKQFSVSIRATDKLPLDGGNSGHGIVVTVTQGKIKDVNNIGLKDFGDGKCVFRSPDSSSIGNNSWTFADIACDDGKILPLSIRLSPAKK